MVEVKVWFGVGMWYCGACGKPPGATWTSSYGTWEKIAAQMVEHIRVAHPGLGNDTPLQKHGEWHLVPHCDLTPAHG